MEVLKYVTITATLPQFRYESLLKYVAITVTLPQFRYESLSKYVTITATLPQDSLWKPFEIRDNYSQSASRFVMKSFRNTWQLEPLCLSSVYSAHT
jgi:hypothetical protein